MADILDIKVLFVDDNKDFLAVRKNAFMDDFTVSIVSSIAEAFTLAKEDISIVVADINMGKEGLITPFLEFMKNEKPYIPVILNSANLPRFYGETFLWYPFIEKWEGSPELESMIIDLVDKKEATK